MIVIVELVDFKSSNKSLEEQCYSSDNQIYFLIKLLQKTLTTKRAKQFSLNFERVGVIDMEKSGYSYDLVLSDGYNCIIVNQGAILRVFHRPTCVQELCLKQLFELEYENNFRCMKLVKEMGEEFIYATNNANIVVKIRVSDVMNKNTGIVWKSESALTNVWGLNVFNNQIYALEYDGKKAIRVLDCKTGNFKPNMETPQLMNGYGIHFLSEKEMIATHSKKLEFFEKNQNGIWESTKQSTFLMSNAYSFFYEESSRLIYISDGTGKQLFVVKRDDFSIVKSINGFEMNFGLIIDQKSGLLYFCDTIAYSVIVYQ